MFECLHFEVGQHANCRGMRILAFVINTLNIVKSGTWASKLALCRCDLCKFLAESVKISWEFCGLGIKSISVNNAAKLNLSITKSIV